MKNRFIAAAAILFFGAALSANAQDKIYSLLGNPIEARVTEIGDNSLYYKAFDNLDGPEYKMSLEFVTKIVYENGKVETFDVPNGRISKHELTDYIGFSVYGSDYRKARAQQKTGRWVTAVGGVTLAAAAVATVAERDDYLAPVIAGLVGVAGLSIGIPLQLKANRKLDAMLDDYTKNYVGSRSASYNPTFSLGATNSGVGLSFNF